MPSSAKMALSWIMSGRLDPSLIRATRAVSKQIDEMKKSAKLLGRQFSFLSKPLKNLKPVLATSFVAAVPTMMLIAKNTATTGDQFEKMSQKMGISAKILSQWSHAANMSGVSTEQFGSNVLKLNQQIAAAATGNKSSQLAFKRAGVSIRDTSGKLKTAEQIMLEMSDTFKKMPEGIYKSDLAMSIFGKSGADMIPLLQNGSKSIKDLIKQADELGMTFSNEESAASAEFCDNLDLLKKNVNGLTRTIGKQLVPIFSPLIKSMSNWISANRELISNKLTEWIEKFKSSLPKIIDFLKEIYRGIVTFATSVDNAIQSLGGWQPVLKNVFKLFLAVQAIKLSSWMIGTTKAAIALGKSFKTLIPLIFKFGVALISNPIGLVITGIVALVAAGYLLYKNWDKVVKFIKEMWDGVKNYFSDKFASITSAFDDGFINGIMNLLKTFNPVTLVIDAIDGIFKYFTGISLIDEGKKFIKSFGDGVINMWNSIKDSIISTITGWIPDWLKDGIISAGQTIGLIDDTTKIDAHHATGAIVRQRQIAEIAEDGPEAIIPLSKPARAKKLLMQSAKIVGMNLGTNSPNNNIFSNALDILPVKSVNSNDHDFIDKITSHLAQTTNNNQQTSFNPAFNPVVNISCVSSDNNELEKRLQKVLKDERAEFEKQFNNYQYQRQRIGVF